jgi:hypothetical protein
MGAFWFKRRKDPPPGVAASLVSEGELPPRSCYSPQYETIVSQGHTRPTPAFGAPTLIWHVAIWPRRQARSSGEPCDPHDTSSLRHPEAKAELERRRKRWVTQINSFLSTMQAKSSPRPEQPTAQERQFKPGPPHDLKLDPSLARADRFFDPVWILEQETVPFILWWADPNETDADKACRNAIRVCVHPEVNSDYACISFYMDIGQRWDAAHSAVPPSTKPVTRREKLLAAVADIRNICEFQLKPVRDGEGAPVDGPAVPETLASPDTRKPDDLPAALRSARNLLYVDIWEQFSTDMSCHLDDVAGDRGEVFANFRGLVLSTEGLTADTGYAPHGPATASVGTANFAKFSGNARFDEDGAEPNAVAKAFWPLLRRITPRADFREFIACGVLNWRAIYMTALGSSSQYVAGHERRPSIIDEGEASIRVPAHLLPDDEKPLAAASGDGHFDSLVHRRQSERVGNNHPVRYLLLTKFEPHPRQIGRIAERINTMGTMRLFALKDWAAIRNADSYIRILGQELDRVTEKWGDDRKLVNELRELKVVRETKAEIQRLEKYLAKANAKTEEERARVAKLFVPKLAQPIWTGAQLLRLNEVLPTYTPDRAANFPYRMFWGIFFLWRRKKYRDFIDGLEEDQIADIRHSALYEISNQVETQLIDISATLDRIGFGAIGGLHFRLNRADFYKREFYILLKTLNVNNIQSWISYDQFVRRGLVPAFDYMAGISKRLRAVRARLLTTTETIETSALVGQSAATRHNTSVLRRTTTIGIVFFIGILFKEQIVKAFKRIVGPIYDMLPPYVKAVLDPILAIFAG